MASRKRARTSSSSSSGVTVVLAGSPLGSKMAAFWRAGDLTDVVVTVEGRSFPAHRLVLAAGAEYFEKLFKSECRDREAPTIKDELPAAAFEPLLAFLYEGSVAVAEELITPLLHAADYLGVEPLKEAAAGALVARLAPSNALATWALAERLSLPSLAEAAKQNKEEATGGTGGGCSDDDGLCVLCYAQPRVLRYRPCGHCVACERCAIRHVLAQLQAGELRPRCSHGCGAEIVDVLRVERADPPIFERDEGNASCQPGAHSLEAFLERAAQKVLRCSVAQDASQAWLRLREAAGARRQLAFFEAVEAGDLDGCVALRRAGASVAQLLRERGADLAAADLDGRTALHFASVNGHLEAGCLTRNASDSPESAACLARAVARWLVGEGVAADSRDAMGRRALDDTVPCR
ncbi:hypothetical protein EMIHUDRAFT_220814 [Emiliania huxleyi CCMP1516]|uniref:BTB domain-containing protein n=2 Tax=Emiliania huxleyi TaxID=2903 RepID=A0A0D3I0A9_EMIH1|nr:hypothetical protein EMIHUDRAFT_220814 [Emiliania huxleyi CCMP1516]EOD04694.1 hypothetical protein EMIHUDRAFT_220814 [Emiliania huxleyi CCMP1516]|eukprot:XP_005757123.1 hypothetical protein EMIHUDRAFT_220814 [Emiliania huxleyi CCMP1516]